ncbi:MAG: LapA family protein [Pseudobdellovibrionaceae bacterium]|jgi:uncharacterized integral membrane protein|nr:LapA family protein [Pseudobdellovibrionaceae bacterium]
MASLLKIISTIFFVTPLFWIILANREEVPLSFAPLWSSYNLPFAAIIFIAVLYGFVWGALIFWVNGSTLRRSFKLQKKEIRKLNTQIGTTV